VLPTKFPPVWIFHWQLIFFCDNKKRSDILIAYRVAGVKNKAAGKGEEA
jgi:hypothetical protein